MPVTFSTLNQVGAVILAAGTSSRMGRPKMILPWGETTVIGQVVKTLLKSGVTKIKVVTGGDHTAVENALVKFPINVVYNAAYANDDMVYSLRLGLASFDKDIQTALVVLGDQPQIEAGTIQSLIEAHQRTTRPLIIPSYSQRRGHPWLVARSLWPDLIAMTPPATMRDFLNDNTDQILYININSPSILKDLDTPDDYQLERPGDHE